MLDQRIPDGKQISVGSLPKGLYLYKINNKGNNLTGKLILE
jgi:hypothetical protein